jgi:small subunit ribosomal protein S3
MLHEDLEMRRIILTRLRNAGIAKIETERSSNAQLTVTIHTAKPGIVIGKGGASVDQMREDLEKRFPGNRIRISIQEIKHPELDAQLVAENIASQIERRISHRRAMKQSILRTMRAGAKGVRIAMGGRLRGGEMARREWDREGRVPLHTLRADIDFGRATARTTFGVIGVKCWIFRDLVEPRMRGGEAAAQQGAEQAAPVQQGDGQPPRRRRRRGGGQGEGGQGPSRQGPPRQQQGPPRQGPPRQQQGPPRQQQGPPRQQQGPPRQQQGPPRQQQGPPRQQAPQAGGGGAPQGRPADSSGDNA